MRKIFIIVYIILVLIVSYSLTIPREIDENSIVSESEIARFKSSLLEVYEKNGESITEEKIEEAAQAYKAERIRVQKASVSGMSFREALNIITIVSLIIFFVLYMMWFFKLAHRGELRGGHPFVGDETTRQGRREKRFLEFFKKR